MYVQKYAVTKRYTIDAANANKRAKFFMMKNGNLKNK